VGTLVVVEGRIGWAGCADVVLVADAVLVWGAATATAEPTSMAM
jgi:hypothetical protein